MKMLLISGLLLTVLSGTVYGQQYGSIGLFAEADRSAWCVKGTGFYPVEMWIMCLPGMNGQICAEFGVRYPSNVIESTITPNDALISVVIGSLNGGISVCYVECQYDWHWNYHQTLWVADGTRTSCEIVANMKTGAYQFANCLDGCPIEPAIKYQNLYINYDSTEPECNKSFLGERSWGAIKEMFD